MNERLIFHVDVNSAFLSWEAARRVRNGEPDLRLIPSCIGARSAPDPVLYRGRPGIQKGSRACKVHPGEGFQNQDR